MAPTTPTKAAQQAETVDIAKVSIKVPPFWECKPDIWFLQLEAQFAINRITSDETKYNHLISQMDAKYIEMILDIITGSGEEKYELAKERLLSTFRVSSEAKLRTLLNDVELGSLRPSRLLLRMQQLAGSDISEKALRTLWLDKLPETIKGILIISEEALERQASMADKIAEMSPHREICSSAPSEDISLSGRIAKIEKMMANMSSSDSSSRRTRGRSQSRSNSRNRFRSQSRSQSRHYDTCWYHYKFGKKAHKCLKPCNWSQGNSSPQQTQLPALLSQTQ